ncbi:hypothetical protein ACO2Q2_13315 [Dyella sp. KRB-257]|uniref:hypothetical protein n=1 Tax=Dyella sp. KRB-257 TaxID=3400915 RepID=UPI003C0FE887
MAAAKLLFVTGLIKRTHEAIPFDVPDYEVRVLQEIHGEDDVIESGEHELPAGDRTAASEYARLLNKYKGHEEQVHKSFRSARELARMSCLPFDEAAAQEPAKGKGKNAQKGQDGGEDE